MRPFMVWAPPYKYFTKLNIPAENPPEGKSRRPTRNDIDPRFLLLFKSKRCSAASSAPEAGGDDLYGAATVPGSADETLVLKIRQVFMNGGQRGESESPSDFLEARSIAIVLNEFIEVVQDLTLTLR